MVFNGGDGDETGIDCGGLSCPPCNTSICSDGIQNGNETGIDCGGDCPPCPMEGCQIPLRPDMFFDVNGNPVFYVSNDKIYNKNFIDNLLGMPSNISGIFYEFRNDRHIQISKTYHFRVNFSFFEYEYILS